jgi:hypothetical protein
MLKGVWQLKARLPRSHKRTRLECRRTFVAYDRHFEYTVNEKIAKVRVNILFRVDRPIVTPRDHRARQQYRATYGSISWIFFACLVRLERCPKAAPQCSHAKGLRFSCTVRTCACKKLFLPNCFGHRSQANGRRRSCTMRICRLRSDPRRNLASHCGQPYAWFERAMRPLRSATGSGIVTDGC